MCSFGRKRARAPKRPSTILFLNKRLVEPSELDIFRKDLEAAHTAALACDTSCNVKRYGSSTWQTALQSDSIVVVVVMEKAAKSLMLQTVISLRLSMCQLLQHVQQYIVVLRTFARPPFV